jgi:hypothetical protein
MKKSKKTKQGRVLPAIDVGNGWLKAKRNWAQIKELFVRHNAMLLLYLIALRAWRGPGMNQFGCRIGEGFIGDFAEWGFTEKAYRVAKKQLEDFGFASFRATNRGTIAKLLTAEIFDINIDLSVTDRAVEGGQGADKGRTEGGQGAGQGRTEGGQGATNKKLRSQEVPRNQEDNNNNNADVVVTGLPSAGEPGAVAPGGGEEVQPPAPVGDMPEPYVEMTPDQKAATLAKELPLYIKCVCKLNQRPTFNAEALQGAVEWFQRNTDHEWWHVQGACALGIKNARENPVPEDAAFDVFFNSRKCAHRPNKLFDTNANGEMYLALIMEEGGWRPDAAHDGTWTEELTEAEVQLALRKTK